MDLMDVQADLQALRKLYGLLQNTEDSLPKTRNEILDERARLLLKDLLDGATEKALDSNSKIIAAAKSGLSKTDCHSNAEEVRVAPKLGSSKPLGVIQSSKKDSNCSKFTSRKIEVSPIETTSEEVVSELSRVGILSKKPDDIKKGCRFCEQSSMKQQVLAKPLGKDAIHQGQQYDLLGPFHRVTVCEREKGSESLKINGRRRRKRINEIQCKPPSVVSPVAACSSSPLGTGVAKPVLPYDSFGRFENISEEVKSDFSREVVNAIRRINSGILDLQSFSHRVDNVKNRAAQSLCKMANSLSPVIQPTEGVVKTSEHTNASQLPNQLVNQRTLKYVDATVERTGTVNRAASQNTRRPSQFPKCVHGSKPPKRNHDVDKNPPLPLKMAEQTIRNRQAQKGAIRNAVNVKARSSMSSHSVGPKNFVPPRQVIVNPTLVEADRERRLTQTRNKVSLYDLESVETPSSSSWTTQQTSMTDSESEANPLQSRKRVHRRLCPRARSFAYVSNKSSSDSEESNSASWGHGQYKVGPTRTYRSDHHANPNKAIGRLRRLRNKLGLILHHHHHHHYHHHHYNRDDNDDSDHLNVNHGKSMWEHLQNIFHHKSKIKVNGKGVEKLRKNTTSIMPRKHQANCFDTLVEGLRRQVRHSKKSKSLKGQNGLKKLHWWRRFKRHGGVKLGKRGRARLGLKNKNSRFRAIKMS